MRPRGRRLTVDRSVLDFVRKSANFSVYSSRLARAVGVGGSGLTSAFATLGACGGMPCAEAAEYDIAPGNTTGGVGFTGAGTTHS